MTVRKAVIPAAGLGTRFLPASKAVPKEMITVVDKPAIQYVVEEAVAAGIEDVLIITSRGKESIADHFDRSPELETALDAKGKSDELKDVRGVAELADVHFVRQQEPLGLGHAVSVARRHVGAEPFAVLLGDDLMVDDGSLLRSMIAAHERHACSVIALKRFPPEQISAYGCVRPTGERDGLVQFDAIVEKPAPEDAPSDLAVMGRYVFTPAIFDALERVRPGTGGELQLTDAIGLLLADDDEEVLGLPFEEGRYDAGNKLDYLKATVELALVRDDVGPAFREWLRTQTWD